MGDMLLNGIQIEIVYNRMPLDVKEGSQIIIFLFAPQSQRVYLIKKVERHMLPRHAPPLKEERRREKERVLLSCVYNMHE